MHRFTRKARNIIVSTVAVLGVFVGAAASLQIGHAHAARLTVAQGAEPLSFDPTQFATGNHVLLHQLYDTLVRLGPDGKPVPALATTWTLTEDGLKARFTLRDARFHSGRPVTAEDVVFTIRRYLTPSVGANLLGRMRSFAGATALDDKTVEIQLSAPTPGLFDLLGAIFIQDSSVIDRLARQDAGSGPYRLTAFQPGVSFVMTRYAEHWNSAVTGPDSITVRIIPDQRSAAAALRAGQIDLMLSASAQQAKDLEGVAGISVWRSDAAPTSYYLMANTSRGPLGNRDFRKALQRAIDRQAIDDIVHSGAAQATCQPWAASHWAFDPALERGCSFDLSAARDHLAKSGIRSPSVTVNTAVESYSPGSVATAQILQQALASIGVTLNIVTYEQAQARQLLLASEFDLLLHQYTEGGNDPQFNMPSALFGPGGRAKFTTPEYERLVAASTATSDANRRKAIYSEISKLIIDEAFVMPIVHGFRAYPMRAGIRGMAIDPSGFPIFWNVVIP